ncbi:MAG: ubiquinol-cytochrome c reductase iron-sulfur subunit [Alphaproteobacteria bacterium]|nr:ubiquinol-cytochrome c reductase iron-sulfur subunit [Alphaproteobacteria bacterium]
MATKKQNLQSENPQSEQRRDFLELLTLGTAAVGGVALLWPLINSYNPSKDVLALASIDVDLSAIEVGQTITVTWRGKPVFIRRRSESEITAEQNVDVSDLRDPEQDNERAENPEWLVVVGICTHLGCVPQGQKVTETRGDYGGWFCPCHGSHYDLSGRIRKGPAPTNLEVPAYQFTTDNSIRIG